MKYLWIVLMLGGCASQPTACDRYVNLVKFNTEAILTTCLFNAKFGEFDAVREQRCDAQFEFVRNVHLDREYQP